MTDTTVRGAGPAARAHHAGGDGPAPERRRRMSAKRKQGAVLRLLRGEDLELVSRQLAVPAAELPAWEKSLGEHDVAIEGRTDWPRGGKSIYFRDPDNHLLELATPGIWKIY